MRSSSCIGGADTFICVLASDIERIAEFAEIKLVSGRNELILASEFGTGCSNARSSKKDP